jgi:hypothetical protein
MHLPEHLPENPEPHIRQIGINEKILPLKRFGQ